MRALKKLLTLVAFSVLLLVPLGVQNVFAVEQIDQQTLSIGNEVTGSACPGGNIAEQFYRLYPLIDWQVLQIPA